MNTKNLFILISLCIGCILPMQAQKQISAKLTDATVYLRGAALTHTASATLKSGSQEVIIDGLSPDIEINSLKVKANGVLISATEFSQDYLTPREQAAHIKKLQDSLDLYQEQLKDVQNELAVHKQLLKLVTDGTQNNMSQKDGTVTIADINANMELYRTKAAELQKSIDKDNKKIEKLKETVNRLNNQINQDETENSQLNGMLRLSVSVPENTTTTFTITYFTNQAQWIPCYDINIPSMDKSITLQAKAKVRQLTGLDWNNVKLTLSNATPNRSAVAPVFKTWFLRFQRPQPQYNNSLAKGYDAAASNSMAYAVAEERSESRPTLVSPKPTAPILMNDFVEVEDQDIQVSFAISVPYDIPGNGKEKLIDLKSYDVKADFKYYSVPKLSDETYLVATLSDYEKYNLLPGEATVTFNNTFVGRTRLRPNDTESQITLTLTTEPRMTVKREKQKDFCSTKHVGNSTTVTQSYLITVKNNLNRTAKLTLKEQYPISNDKDIEVKDVTITPKATYDKSDIGVVTWDVELQAGETRTFTVTYSVKHPSDRTIAW
ncbi:MAG: mucoidy inhibitor MuiA family protein [Bacteroidales bacterium]|nr:mucoidy inhibitor MuiA family protein [Bacteroidales bacterium]